MSVSNLAKKLQNHRVNDLYREPPVIENRDYNLVAIKGNTLLDFTSNDYLGIARDPLIKAALMQGASQYGLGSGASALISGYSLPHQQLEESFAAFLHCDQAILFNSGYQANLGLFSTLADKNSNIIADKLCHASIIDGIKLSNAKLYRYGHNDICHAERLLQKAKDHSLLVTESIFSMEGDIAAIDQLASLSLKYGANLIVDDAHAIGILGPNGGGSTEHHNLDQHNIACLIVPLGKAFGSMGAMIAGRNELIDALRQFARTYIYTTMLPPVIAYATIKSLEIVKKEHSRRQKLQENIAYFIKRTKELGIPLICEDLTPIKAILTYSNSKTISIQQHLAKKGLLVSCIRPPTVPMGTARIRVSLNCWHHITEINTLLEALAEVYHDSSHDQ